MRKLQADEKLPGTVELTVGDFWSWAFSDVLCNVNRSTFAEFLVGSALGVIDEPRVEWDSVDLRYRGRGIEVKSSAYLQSWPQSRLSDIRFDIAKKRVLVDGTNTYSSEPLRSADCYVFCLYPETDPEKADILDVGAWRFYALSKDDIERRFGDQRSTCLGGIEGTCEPISYRDLRCRIDALLCLD